MGGGFTFTGNSTSIAAAAPPSLPSGRSFHTPNSEAGTCSETKPHTQSGADTPVLGSVPSRAEVERAVHYLHRFMHGLSASKPELHGINNTPGFVKFKDAFSMMLTQPALRDIIVSISCDKAVWEAILSNKAVQDLQAFIPNPNAIFLDTGEEDKVVKYREGPDITILILKWIMGFTKSKILELVDKFIMVVNEMFQLAPKEKGTTSEALNDLLEEKVRSSFLLSVIILLIVVITRKPGLM